MNAPVKTKVLVIGGGPAGSTAAAFLAREGVEVVLVEREVFPRYHIGESLLPSCLEILALLGAREKVEAHGFQCKPGAYLEWKGEQWALDFGELRGNYQHAFQVPRAEFDHLLLQHAAELGVQVLEGTQVKELTFVGERPVSARLQTRDGGEPTELAFDYLVDASGRSGLMATRYLKNRTFHEIFKNVAVWGYWQGVTRLEGREGAIAVGSIPDGWLWAIPFADGQMSVGVVIHKDAFKQQRGDGSLADFYHQAIASSSLMTRMTGTGVLTSELLAEQDYSYASSAFSGPGFFLVGDAACFLDPLLSTGVHLAMYGGLLAAAGVCSAVRGEVSEHEAQSYHDQSYRQAYMRFLVFVAAFYEQRGKLGYFSQAEKLSHFDADPSNIKRAFLNLVSGLEDLADAEKTTSHLMGEMSRRIAENMELRKDKAAPKPDAVDDNARFFDGIEGLASLSPDNAIDGLYVSTVPRLGLRRVTPPAERPRHEPTSFPAELAAV